MSSKSFENQKASEAKNTHFRTWKSGKIWLYGSVLLSMLVVGGLAVQPSLHAAADTDTVTQTATIASPVASTPTSTSAGSDTVTTTQASAAPLASTVPTAEEAAATTVAANPTTAENTSAENTTSTDTSAPAATAVTPTTSAENTTNASTSDTPSDTTTPAVPATTTSPIATLAATATNATAVKAQVTMAPKVLAAAVATVAPVTPATASTTATTTTTGTTLQAGQSYQTGDNLTTTDPWNLQNTSTWSAAGSATMTSNSTTTTVTLVNNTKQQAGYAVLGNAIDMSQSFTISGITLKTDAADGKRGPAGAGDALGLILTPVSGSGLTKGATGGGLGIQGLPNTIFAGRDLYANNSGSSDSTNDSNFGTTTLDGNTPYASNQIAIRTTTTTGNMVTGVDTTSDNLLTGSNAKQSGTVISSGTTSNNIGINDTTAWPTGAVGKNTTSGDTVSMTWTVSQVNSDGTVTGTLSYTENGQAVSYTNIVGANKQSFAASQTLTETLTVPQNMSLGVIGASGGYTSNMTVSLTNASITNATRATDPVTVNYVDTAGKTLGSASTINTTIGDGIAISTATGAVSFTTVDGSVTTSYKLPTFAGYNAISSIQAPASVQNYASGTTNPNIITVTYQAQSESANFAFDYVQGTPGTTTATNSTIASAGTLDVAIPTTASALPATITETGSYTAAIANPNIAAPAGYVISGVVAPNGTSYADMTTALAANSSYALDTTTTVNKSNNFIVLLSAASNSATFAVSADAGVNYTGATSLSSLSYTTTGSTGTPISGANLPSLASGYYYDSISAPNGVTYSVASSAGSYAITSGATTLATTTDLSAAETQLLSAAMAENTYYSGAGNSFALGVAASKTTVNVVTNSPAINGSAATQNTVTLTGNVGNTADFTADNFSSTLIDTATGYIYNAVVTDAAGNVTGSADTAAASLPSTTYTATTQTLTVSYVLSTASKDASLAASAAAIATSNNTAAAADNTIVTSLAATSALSSGNAPVYADSVAASNAAQAAAAASSRSRHRSPSSKPSCHSRRHSRSRCSAGNSASTRKHRAHAKLYCIERHERRAKSICKYGKFSRISRKHRCPLCGQLANDLVQRQ